MINSVEDFAEKFKVNMYYPKLWVELPRRIGLLMKEQRIQRAFTRSRLAQKISSNPLAIGDLESGEIFHGLSLFLAACEYFHLAVGSLVTEAHLDCLMDKSNQGILEAFDERLWREQ